MSTNGPSAPKDSKFWDLATTFLKAKKGDLPSKKQYNVEKGKLSPEEMKEFTGYFNNTYLPTLKSMQESKKQIEASQKRIKELQDRNCELQARMDANRSAAEAEFKSNFKRVCSKYS